MPVSEKPRILMIDDSLVSREMLSRGLGEEYEIHSFSDGDKLLEKIATIDPDIILLDEILRKESGHDLCRIIRRDPMAGSIPVIFITASDTNLDEEAGLNAGAIDYITKPWHLPIVRARLRNHIELKKIRDRLEDLSYLDGLTGITNRRRFMEHLQIAWMKGVRKHSPIALLLMDIDFFKLYNDHYGHPQGDECLKSVAHLLRDAVEPFGVVARYGGEEFIVLLDDSDTTNAWRIAGKISDALAALNIPHAKSTVRDTVTLSIGVASVIPSSGTTPDALIEAADKALYVAKRNGRDRVEANESWVN